MVELHSFAAAMDVSSLIVSLILMFAPVAASWRTSALHSFRCMSASLVAAAGFDAVWTLSLLGPSGALLLIGIGAAASSIAFTASTIAFVLSSRFSNGMLVEPLVFLVSGIVIYALTLMGALSIFVCACGLVATLTIAQIRREDELSHLSQSLARARADTVLSLIRPHFLYNTITAIRRLCRIEPLLAGEMLGDFADYLRSNADSLTQKRPIPFEEELRHARKYLELEGLRLGDRLKVDYVIGTTDFEIPVLTLQTLAENAVRHGIGKREEGGVLTITTRKEPDDVVLLIEDDGVGFDTSRALEDPSAHLGLENTRLRLSRMCGAALEVESEPGIGTRVAVHFPREAQNAVLSDVWEEG